VDEAARGVFANACTEPCQSDRLIPHRPQPQKMATLTAAADVAACGFELIENLSSTEQMTRYFSNRKDYLRPLAGSYFARLRVSE